MNRKQMIVLWTSAIFAAIMLVLFPNSADPRVQSAEGRVFLAIGALTALALYTVRDQE